MLKVVATACAALICATVARAEAGPRLYSSHPQASLRQFETDANRFSAFKEMRCRLYGGDANRGWRHIGCTATYHSIAGTYRVRLTATPLTCDKLQETIAVSGSKTQTSVGAWHQEDFQCRA
jgi:hypothetical protein